MVLYTPLNKGADPMKAVGRTSEAAAFSIKHKTLAAKNTPQEGKNGGQPALYTYRIVEQYPHDYTAFTQGRVDIPCDNCQGCNMAYDCASWLSVKSSCLLRF